MRPLFSLTLFPLFLLVAAPCGRGQTSPAPLRTYGESGEAFVLGPSQIVRTKNGKLTVSDRAGVTLSQEDVDDWWSNKAGGSSRRPQGLTIAFDPVIHRWIAAAYDEYNGYSGNTNEVWISLSHTEDFSGKWTLFTFDEATVQGDEYEDLQYADYRSIKLGFGGGIVAATILLDDYDGRNEDFEEDDSGFVVVALGDIEGGTGNNPLTARQTKVSHEDFPYDEGCPVPARTFSSASGLYFLSLEEEDPGTYGLSKLSFSGSNFSFSKNFSTFEVDSLGSDPGRVGAAQPNTTVKLIHNDEWAIPGLLGHELIPDHRQIRDVMIRDGFLWAVHEGIDNGAEVVRTHWLCISMATPVRFIAQSGRLGGSNGLSCISPSIAVNANRDVLIGFTATGAHTFPSASYVLRFGTDAPGTMRGIRHYVEGTASYVNEHTFYPGTTMWPGHTRTQADPGDAAGLWTSQQYRTESVTTQIVQVTGNVPPAITQHPVNRTVVPNANTSLSVTATGTNLQYQWFLEEELAGGGTSATINITGVNALKVGYYKCRVSNAGGTVWSNTALVRLTTGNPGVFSFVDLAGNELTSVNWTEPSDSIFLPSLSYRNLIVRRTNGSDGRVRVSVNVRGRFDPPAPTATNGWDFTGIVTPPPNSRSFSGPGALTFQDGETQKTISVWLRRETMVESSLETMEATMAVDPALGAATSTPQIDISLLDNDTAPSFAAAVDYNVTYTNENNRWKPQTSITSDGVDAVQSDISAPGGDPTVFGTTFGEGGTLTWRWRADGDAGDRLQLVHRPPLAPVGVTAAEIRGGTDWQTAAVAITDPGVFTSGVDWKFFRGADSENVLATAYVDQIRFHSGTGGVVEFERATYSVDEGAGTVTLTIKRLGHTATAGIIGVTLLNDTATGGSDFQALGLGVFTFAAGQTSRTVNFTIFPDQIAEPVETFRAVLSEQGSGQIDLGPVSTATISIVDQPGETYASWAATKFSAAQLAIAGISGKDANPDSDALLNVMEYALDGDPLSAASAPQPQSLFEEVSGEDISRHVLIFPRRKQSLDLTYKVQRTTDLTAWQDGATLTPTGTSSFPGIVQLVSAAGGPVETRTVRDGVAVNDGQRAWLRLQVLCP